MKSFAAPALLAFLVALSAFEFASASCSAQTAPGNGTVLCTNGTNSSSVCAFSCNTGYTLSGESHVLCQANGTWNASAPTCTIVDCGSLGSPSNGAISCTGTTYGSTCNATCTSGYRVLGSASRTCQADGQWSGSVASCDFIDCGSLSAPGNGSVVCSGSTLGAVCNFTCNTGWNLGGSAQRVCGQDEQWSGLAANCTNPLCVSDGRMVWGIATGVDSTWTTVDLTQYCFDDPIVITTATRDNNTIPIVPRLRYSNGASDFRLAFDVRLQSPKGAAVVPDSVHWIAIEHGMWRMPDGDKIEARRYLSNVTDYQATFHGTVLSFWHTYANPVVLGQVMTSNDADFSNFWTSAASNINNRPTAIDFKAGKEVGNDPDRTRADEMIGFIAIETANGFANGIKYEAFVGGNSVRGTGDSPPYTYTPGFTSPSVGVGTKATVKGGDGGWLIWWDDNPLRAGQIRMAIQEETVGDSDTAHTSEEVGVFVFDTPGSTPLDNGCTCGDGIICGLEQCDGGACCSDQCTFRSSAETCRPESGVCDLAELCTGSSSTCPTDVFRTPGSTCAGSSQGTCNSFQQCQCDAGYYTAFTDSFPCLRYDTVIPACVAPACTLSASWNTSSGLSAVSHAWGAFQDAETGVQYYEWAIGTQINATAALGWQRVSTSDPRSGTVGGLQLVVGTPYVVWVRAFDAANGTGNVTSSTFHVTSGTVSTPSSSTTQQFSVPLKVSGASDFNERTDVSLQFSNAIEFTSNSFRYIPVTQSAVATEVDSFGSPFLENPFNPPSGLFATGISMSLNRCTTGACTQTDSSSIKLASQKTFVMTMDLTPTSYRTFMNGSLSLYFYDRAEDEWIPVSSPAYDCDAQGKNVTFDPVTFEVRAELCRTGQFAMFSAQALPVSGGGGGDDGAVSQDLLIIGIAAFLVLLFLVCIVAFFIGRRRSSLEDERRSRLKNRLDMIRNKLQTEQGDMVFKRRPMIAGNATQQAMMAFGGLYRGVAPGGGQPFALPGPAGWEGDDSASVMSGRSRGMASYSHYGGMMMQAPHGAGPEGMDGEMMDDEGGRSSGEDVRPMRESSDFDDGMSFASAQQMGAGRSRMPSAYGTSAESIMGGGGMGMGGHAGMSYGGGMGMGGPASMSYGGGMGMGGPASMSYGGGMGMGGPASMSYGGGMGMGMGGGGMNRGYSAASGLSYSNPMGGQSMGNEMWQRARNMRRVSLPNNAWRRPSAFGSRFHSASAEDVQGDSGE